MKDALDRILNRTRILMVIHIVMVCIWIVLLVVTIV
jgi:hypothetical protein